MNNQQPEGTNTSTTATTVMQQFQFSTSSGSSHALLQKAREGLQRILQSSEDAQTKGDSSATNDIKGTFPFEPEGVTDSKEDKAVLNCLPIFFGSPPPHESGPETRSEGFTSDAITKASIDSLKKRVRKRWSLNGYRCSHCPKIFNSSSAKFHHERNHTKPFKCTVCSQGWPSNFARLLHMARKHSQKKPKEDLPISTHPKKLKLNSAQGISPVVQIYTCSECPFTTKNHPALYAHKKHHGTQHAHKCPHCSCAFTKIASLSRHTNRNHSQFSKTRAAWMREQEDFTTCLICNQTVHTVRMTAHRKVYHPELKPYLCTKCPYATGNVTTMYFHRKSHEIPNEFNCTYCSASYRTLLRVNNHIRKAHPDCPGLPSSGKARQTTSLNAGSLNDQVPYMCILCSRIYSWESDLRRHMGIHIMAFTCSVCSRRFPDKYALRYHLKRGHASNRLVRSRRSRKAKGLQKKNRTEPVCQKATEIPCPVCATMMAGKTKLGLHLKLDHPQFEAYRCSECPFRTANQNVFYSHSLIHQRDEIFKCGCCSASFENLRTREQHVNSVHPGMTPELPKAEQALTPRKAAVRPTGYYKAIEAIEVGGESAVSLAQEVVCRICRDVSSTRSGFDYHFAKCHPNEKPYLCGECPFQCVNYATITAHEKLHSEENEFKCSYCSASFVNTIRRSIHVKSVHKQSSAATPTLQTDRLQNFAVTPAATLDSANSTNSEPQVQYECGECNGVFPFSFALKIHQRAFHPLLGWNGQN